MCLLKYSPLFRIEPFVVFVKFSIKRFNFVQNFLSYVTGTVLYFHVEAVVPRAFFSNISHVLLSRVRFFSGRPHSVEIPLALFKLSDFPGAPVSLFPVSSYRYKVRFRRENAGKFEILTARVYRLKRFLFIYLHWSVS